MAADWIKVENTTPEKPEIKNMARELGISKEAVCGHLLRVWIWADQQSIDGNAISVTASDIDDVARMPGMASALRNVRWLEGEDGAMSFPKFTRHNTEPAKKRALAKDRQQTFRERSGNANVTQSSLPEKRREEVTTRLDIKTTGDVVPEKQKPTPSLENQGEGGPPGRRRAARAPETLLPDEFVLTPEMGLYAETVLGDLVDAPAMFSAFRLHHAAKQSLFRDWSAAWRTWVQNGLQYGFPKKKPGGVGGAAISGDAPSPLSPAGEGTRAAGERWLGRGENKGGES